MTRRTVENWGRRDEDLVVKTEAGDWRSLCPWCEEIAEAPTRGEALEIVADHIIEEHA